MVFILLLSITSLAIAASASAVAQNSQLEPLFNTRHASHCVNCPTDRGCWTPGLNISTDAESSYPITNKIVPYTLVIDEGYLSPDGTSNRTLLLINGTYPGPVLTADWGDTLEITVINNLKDNGTSIHWHGVSQKNSSLMDGANGITECPILGNGTSKTYRFICNEFGTTWYHSHYTAQYGDGIVGTIIINGPASANYHIDLGTFPITDWYYKSMWDEVQAVDAQFGAPPPADNLLINGKNKNPNGTTGEYDVQTLTPGKKHRLRIINTSVENMFQVSLDSHTFQVIQADFVPIVPYYTTSLFVGIGQRYDVIIDASEVPDNYWFRVNISSCSANLNPSFKSIFTYECVKLADPTSSPQSIPVGVPCVDEFSSNLRPYVPKSVDETQFNFEALGEHVVDFGLNNTILWTVDTSSLNVDWEKPTLAYVANDSLALPRSTNVYEVNGINAWVFWVIQQATDTPPIAHPIHLHGHDFYLLGANASDTFTASKTSSLNFYDPPRRDVALLPGLGWMVIAFQTDNPGAWLLHCHIAWHVGGGLGAQFLERESEIKGVMDLSSIEPECRDWAAWYENSPFKKNDSGL